MQMRCLRDVFTVIDKLYVYLSDKDICFDEEGFPIFKGEMFLDEWPELMVPFSQRNNRRVLNKKKTVLCFFDKDHHLYPRAAKVIDEIEEYKQYMGAVGLDVTVTEDMDQEWQKAILLLNQLFLVTLAVNGVKIVINTRTAGQEPDCIFKNIPSGIMAASGFLGCERIGAEDDFSYVKKILALLPDKLMIYGKHDLTAEHQLDVMGIDYRVYKDFHRLCKEVHHG